MAEIKDKVVTAESLSTLHEYNKNAYMPKVDPANVEFASSLSGNESFLINQSNTFKQISKDNIVFDIKNGGTNATNGSDGLYNLLSDGALILTSHQYGDTLPDDATQGRIFFKKVSN